MIFSITCIYGDLSRIYETTRCYFQFSMLFTMLRNILKVLIKFEAIWSLPSPFHGSYIYRKLKSKSACQRTVNLYLF